MISRILCPTDFSPASINATEYASRLAAALRADLTLMHVQQIYTNEGLNLLSGQELQSVKEARTADEHMKDVCAEISRVFGVSCDHEVMTTTGAFVGRIAGEASHFDLTVIGSNGADSAYQFYFGSHSYHVARKTDGPVLIVPENFAYAAPKNVIFASDFVEGHALPVAQLLEFVKGVHATVATVHLSTVDTEKTRRDFQAFSDSAGQSLQDPAYADARRIVSEDPVEALFDFLVRTRADVVALSMQHHGLLYEATHTSLVKKITAGSVCPVLVFHK